MRFSGLVVLTFASVLVAQQPASQPTLSPAFRDAALDASDALELLPLTQNSDSEFQPRKLEAEKAVKKARRAAQSDAEVNLAQLLNADLQFRLMALEMEREGKDPRTPVEQMKQDFDESIGYVKNHYQCMAEVKVALNDGVDKLTSEQITAGHNQRCLKLYDQMNDAVRARATEQK